MGEITLQQALNEFKTVYMPARNLAARTRIEYANDLKALIDYLNTIGITRAGEISGTHIDRYLARLDELGLSGSTRKRKAITFRAFLSFLYRNGYISQDISGKVILPFPEQPVPRVLTQSEYQSLLQACAGNIRDTATIALLLQTGIRLSELTRLTVANVHIPESIEISGSSTRKGRVIPLNSKACDTLQAYISIRPTSTSLELFLNKQGKKLGDRGVEKMVSRYYLRARIAGASVQTLRHTFAVQHLVKGTGLKIIQKAMGHQDIRTTEEYIPLANYVAKKELEENAL